MITLLTTVTKRQGLYGAIRRLSPDAIVLIIIKGEDYSILDAVAQDFSDILTSVVFIDSNQDISSGVSSITDTIDKECVDGHRIRLVLDNNILGWSIQLAMMLRADKIEDAFYLNGQNELSLLPILDFNMSGQKKSLLCTIASGCTSIPELIRQTGKSQSMVYAHLKSLRRSGLIDQDNRITSLGRMHIL